jgi:limonene-1,2-epoxide hydrolase
MTNPAKVVRAFVEAINRHDVAALAALMTADHAFVDAAGAVFTGRDAMTDGWRGYLAWFPDYQIEPETWFADGPTVAFFGRARGTFAVDGVPRLDRRWDLPAAWLAVVRGDLVAEWRVFCDTKTVFELMRDP